MTEDTVLYGGYEGTWVSMGMLRDILLAVREVDALEDDESQRTRRITRTGNLTSM